jgi:hypothetical protein
MVNLFHLNSTAILILHRNTPTLHRATLLKVHQSTPCPQATCNKDLLMVMSHLRNLLEHRTLVKKLVANVLTKSRTRQLFLPRTLHRLLRSLNNNNSSSNKDLLHLTASLSTPTLTLLS